MTASVSTNAWSAASKGAHGLLIAASLGVAGIIGWLDYVTGWEWSLFVLYAVPIFVLAWYVNQRTGVAMAMACAVIWWMANEAASPYETHLGFAMAAATRMAYFVFVGVGGAALRAREEMNAARISALERTRSLERDLVRVSEHEQRRIGQDLHDGVCQNLVAIACAVRALQEDIEAGRAPAPEEAAQIERMLRDTTMEARQLARRFFPAHMEGEGLGAAIHELVHSSARGATAALQFHEDVSDSGSPSPEVAVHLFRITQEALNNALKHSRATQIAVRFRAEEGRTIVEVTDNGIGPAAVAESASGMGLKTMTYRARQIGADLEIKRAPDGGTTVTCEWRAAASPSKELPPT